MFNKFIWNGGNDRVQRKLMCNEFSQCGLRMVDPYTYALAQKMTWVKHLIDDGFDSMWKTIELDTLKQFHPDVDILWNSCAPECVLKSCVIPN